MCKSNSMSQSYEFEILQNKIKVDNDNVYIYGLKFTMQDGTIETFEDITLSREKIELLFDIFINESIEITHIEEIICDFVDMLHSVII